MKTAVTAQKRPDDMKVEEEKERFRKKAIRLRRAIDPEVKTAWDRQIFFRITDFRPYHEAEILHTYVSKSDEVDTHRLIQSAIALQKTVIVPRVVPGTAALEHYRVRDFSELVPGTFGILEPDPRRCEPAGDLRPEIIFVPGCAFDRNGNRLGYGKGFYDRFLSGTPGLRVGLAYALQLFDRLPVQSFDVPMDYIIMENGILKVRQ